MDTLGGLLDAPRARGAFALRVVMSAPWSLRIQAESPLTLIAGVAGDVWVVPDDGKPVRLGPGDVAVTRAPDHYNVSDTPVGTVAEKVGYATPFAFSAAFKRVRGISPQKHRAG